MVVVESSQMDARVVEIDLNRPNKTVSEKSGAESILGSVFSVRFNA